MKVLNSGPLEAGQSTSAKKSYPSETRNLTLNGTGALLKKPKSSSIVKATEKKLTELQGGVELNKDQSGSKEPKVAADTTVDDSEDAFTTDDSEEEDIDDQTEALLKGFESDDDEAKDPEDQGYEAGEDIPKISKKTRKKAKAAEKDSASGKPGVVYVGRIPHGFYEQEMKQYFSQFGNITNLRLSRNRKTGKSKHFAFVEFESAEVAKIVSKTMDNYLLFGHILKCKLVAPEQVHKDLWIGANKRFKSVPWNKIQGRKLSQPMAVASWESRKEKEEKRRADKKAAMKLIDYDFESPKLKSAKEVLKKSKQAVVETVGKEGEDEEPKAIEASEGMEDQAVVAKSKKNKQEKKDTGAADKPSNSAAEVAGEPGKKMKNKKKKSSDKLVIAEEFKKSVAVKDANAGPTEEVEKVKKSKKYRAT